MCSVQCAVCRLQCAVCSVHCAVYLQVQVVKYNLLPGVGHYRPDQGGEETRVVWVLCDREGQDEGQGNDEHDGPYLHQR